MLTPKVRDLVARALAPRGNDVGPVRNGLPEAAR